ncbi:hypothetical protein KI387_027678, partial [Taxus chinensis]
MDTIEPCTAPLNIVLFKLVMDSDLWLPLMYASQFLPWNSHFMEKVKQKRRQGLLSRSSTFST